MSFNKNDEVCLTIENFGNEGEGIGRIDGYTLFVKGAVPGDKIKARILKANKNYGFAKIEELLEASPDRENPPCPVYDKCGGCSLMHVKYARELKYKEDKVRDCIERIGGFERGSFIFNQIVGMENASPSNRPLRYRNKAQFPVGLNNDGKIITGFYASRSHRITPITDCPIEASVTGDILRAVKKYMAENNILAYDEVNHKGLIRHIMTRLGFATGEVGICLVINGDKLPFADKLIPLLKEAMDGKYNLTSVCVNINKEKTNVIMGKKLSVIYGRSYITDKIGDIAFHISPMSFYQVNHTQTEKLYAKALEYAALTGNETVWDLYCGIGTISLFLAKKAAKVYGVEIVPEAIENAKENAKLNNIVNAEFTAGAAEAVAIHLPKPDVIVVDPPRKGCDGKLIETILKYKPNRLVYVSCDPATLARDLKLLAADGAYKLIEVTPVDQFSGSFHVETVCMMLR